MDAVPEAVPASGMAASASFGVAAAVAASESVRLGPQSQARCHGLPPTRPENFQA